MDNAKRLELQTLLEGLLGSENVYFQPPASIRMRYPAIVYRRDDIDNRSADNSPYRQQVRYSVSVIDADPDSKIVSKVAKLPLCRYDRGYVSDNLNHDVFTLYF